MRKGLDYFPLDCHMDDSVRLIEAELGLWGFAVIIKLWQEIYKGEGYFKKFDDDVQLLFSKEVNIDLNELKRFLQISFQREIFSRELFDKYKILTSKGIQERFLKCTRKRKSNTIKDEFMLILSENDAETVKNDAETVKNDADFKQSKVKESKVKESKGEKSKNTSDPQDKNSSDKFYGEYKNVHLTDRQRDELLSELTEAELNDYIRRIDEYMQETGKVYKNCFLVIRRWFREDKDKRARAPSGKKKKCAFVNYTDTGDKDYDAIGDEILRKILEEN